MKNLVKILALLATTALACVSCSKEEESAHQEPQIEVNYATVDGHWQLESLNETPIAGTAYFYISLARKEHLYEMYDNIESGVSHNTSGEYALDNSDDWVGTVISGIYVNEMGRPWNNQYIITSLTASTMTWKTVDSEEIQKFRRVAEIPADILNGTRSVR